MLRMYKVTAADREEVKKKEKENRKLKTDEDDMVRVQWAKYTLGLKHQVS